MSKMHENEGQEDVKIRKKRKVGPTRIPHLNFLQALIHISPFGFAQDTGGVGAMNAPGLSNMLTSQLPSCEIPVTQDDSPGK